MQISGDNSWFLYLPKCLQFFTVLMFMEQKYSFRSFLSVAWPTGFNWCFSFAPALVSYLAPRDLHRRVAYSICESSFLIHHIYQDLFVCP